MGGPRGSGPGSVFAFLVNFRNIEIHFDYEHYFQFGQHPTTRRAFEVRSWVPLQAFLSAAADGIFADGQVQPRATEP